MVMTSFSLIRLRTWEPVEDPDVLLWSVPPAGALEQAAMETAASATTDPFTILFIKSSFLLFHHYTNRNSNNGWIWENRKE